MSEEVVSAGAEKDDEISLIDLFAVLLRFKWLIIGITGLAMVVVVVVCVISLKLPPEDSFLPNKYKVSANMLITDSKNNSGPSLSGSASALASMMGVSVGGGSGSTSSLILYLTSSNPFYDAIAERFNLYEKFDFEKSPIANTRRTLSKQVSADYDSDSGVLTMSFEDIDPEYAVAVVNFIADWIASQLDALGVDSNTISKENIEKNIDVSWSEILNLTKRLSDMQDKVAQGRAFWTKDDTVEQQRIELELEAQKEVYTQLRSQLELLKVNMGSETPIFQILERPTVPDIKSGPSRGKLCIIVTFAAFFMSIFLAFLINAIKNMRNDPEVMQKLSPGSKDGAR